jgi:hypothetical protein
MPKRDALKARKLAVKYKYGLDWDEFTLLHEKASARCEICEKPLILSAHPEMETVYIDHCHETKKVHGILCLKCNVGLGAFKDSRLHLNRAIAYLDKHANR